MAKRAITLTLYMSELLYDIKNKTDITGRRNADGSNEDKVALMKVTDDEDTNQIMRSIGNALAVLKTKLAEYVQIDSEGATDELLSATSNIEIVLQMPTNYNTTMNDAINAAMHRYIVDYAIGDWFAITDKEDATTYLASADADLAALNEAMNKRNRPPRPDGTSPSGDEDIDEYYFS